MWHSHPFAERLATYACRGLDSNTQPSACGANALTHCATAAVYTFVIEDPTPTN